jgi:precorrin-6A/cobalt-precorrin-6A reductase
MAAPILKHPTAQEGGGRVWLLAGTGEGPPLAEALGRRGWQVRVSVVSGSAALAYPPRPWLEVAVGAIGDGDAAGACPPEEGVRRELERAASEGRPFRWVVDATHPFAHRISAALATACGARHQPLLRLGRPLLPAEPGTVLADAAQLAPLLRPGERLLLALGARRLQDLVRQTPAAVHHARILPSAAALRQARAAGLPDERIACLRPGGDGSVERGLCRHWRIETVVCRRSGGPPEQQWQTIATELGLRLLRLERPAEPEGVACLPAEALLARIGMAP